MGSGTHPIREAKVKKNEKELRELKGIMNTTKWTNTLITGAPEGEQREKGGKKLI